MLCVFCALCASRLLYGLEKIGHVIVYTIVLITKPDIEPVSLSVHVFTGWTAGSLVHHTVF